MPSNYKRKPKKYSQTNLMEAIGKVKRNILGIRKAVKKYEIDKSLLSRMISGKACGVQGRKPILSAAQEKNLCDYLCQMAKWGVALSKRDVLEVVSEFVSEQNIPNSFKNGVPGNDWFRLFCKRNNMNLKKLEALDSNRRTATSDPYIIYGFYDLLYETIEKLQIQHAPDHIWNLDETYFCSDPSRVKGLTGKGQKAHRTIMGTGRENTSVLACCSAVGRVLPPLIIYESMNLWSTWKGDNALPGTFYACTERGYMTAPVFSSYMKKFAHLVEERPLLLIFDGHMSHMDITTLEFARNNNIVILKLPPHSTDLLQPLDKCCFGPLKAIWNTHLVEWQRKNQRKLTKSEFVDLLSSVWHKGLRPETVIAGFKSTGIFPPNRTKYLLDRLNPMKLQRYLEGKGVDENTGEDETDKRESCAAIVTDHTTSLGLLNTPGDGIGLPSGEGTSGADSDVGTTSDNNPDKTIADPLALNTPNDVIAKSSASSLSSDSFERLLLERIQKTSAEKKTRRKIDTNARVITSEEYLTEITNKMAATTKKKVVVKKEVVPNNKKVPTKRAASKNKNATPKKVASKNSESTKEEVSSNNQKVSTKRVASKKKNTTPEKVASKNGDVSQKEVLSKKEKVIPKQKVAAKKTDKRRI